MSKGFKQFNIKLETVNDAVLKPKFTPSITMAPLVYATG